MKRLLLVLLLLMCCVPFASAASWLYINQGTVGNGTNWTSNTTGGYADGAYNVGDGNLITYWYHYQQPAASITWLNPLGIYYSKIRLYIRSFDGEPKVWTCNGVEQSVLDDTWTNFSVSGSGPLNCFNSSTTQLYMGIKEIVYENGTAPTVVADFNAIPLSGSVPLTVQFQDNSTGLSGSNTFNWSVSPAGGVAIDSPVSANTVMHFGTIGNYTITHGVSNGANSDIETKTDYIWVYNSIATQTTSFRTINYYDGGTIHNTTINLNDVENSSWTNTTQSATGQASITTLSGHTINAYASGWGWIDADLLGTVADGQYHSILMRPYGAGFNVSAGNVTLLVTVAADDNAELLENVKLSVLLDSGGTWIGYTNAAGAQYFTVANNTDIRITATKVGFGDATYFDNTGLGDGGNATKLVSITMIREFVTPTPVVTTLPGGGYPTTAVTPDPAGSPGDPGYSNAKGQEMMDYLAENGPLLVQICVMVTVLGLLGVRLGK